MRDFKIKWYNIIISYFLCLIGAFKLDILSNEKSFYFFVLFCFALALAVMGFILRSPFGRRKTFSRPSMRMRASDLYRGVTRLTAAIESAAASRVGTMIQFPLRTRASPSDRRSRSPDADTEADSLAAGADLATSLRSDALSMPARQNAKRIAHSRRRHDSTYPADYTPLRLPLG